MMKIKEKEFALNIEEGLVDFSSKKGRKSEKKNGRKNNDFVVLPEDVYSEPIEQFDDRFVEDLKVSPSITGNVGN